MKYYNKITKNEVPSVRIKKDLAGKPILGDDIVELSSDNPHFNPIPDGKQLAHDDDGIPILVDIPESHLKRQEIASIKNQRNLAMSKITITHNSKEWSFTPVDMSRFESKIARQRDFTWKADDDSHVTLTPTVAENIAKKVDDAMTQIFFDAETAIAAL